MRRHQMASCWRQQTRSSSQVAPLLLRSSLRAEPENSASSVRTQWSGECSVQTCNWLQVVSLYSSSLWQRSSVRSQPTSLGQCLIVRNIKCVPGCLSVCSSPPRCDAITCISSSSPVVAITLLVVAYDAVRPHTYFIWRCATCCSSCAQRNCSRPTQQPTLER